MSGDPRTDVTRLLDAQHRLDLFEPGSFIGASVVCLGGPENQCQQWCAEGCEEYCTVAHVCDDDPDDGCLEPCPRDGDEHRWEPIGSCRVADWINACGIEDTYAGDDEILRFDDDGETQPGIRSGLIAEEWNGDDYVWRYADGPLAAAVLAAPLAGKHTTDEEGR